MEQKKKLTVPDIGRMKAAGERISMVTAYDCPFARLLDEAGVDILLVGDSLGMVVQGLETTLPVTLDEIVYHTRMVARGRRRALVLGDLPFGSYQASPMRAVESAIRLVKEGGAEAVKLEGGTTMARTIEAIAAIDIPVVGHVGLTPQSVHRMGGHRVQGRRGGHAPGERDRVLDDARAVQAAGPSHSSSSAFPSTSPPRSPPSSPSRRSVSVPGPTATARCSSCTTSLASRPTGRPASPSATPSSGARSCAPPAPTWKR